MTQGPHSEQPAVIEHHYHALISLITPNSYLNDLALCLDELHFCYAEQEGGADHSNLNVMEYDEESLLRHLERFLFTSIRRLNEVAVLINPRSGYRLRLVDLTRTAFAISDDHDQLICSGLAIEPFKGIGWDADSHPLFFDAVADGWLVIPKKEWFGEDITGFYGGDAGWPGLELMCLSCGHTLLIGKSRVRSLFPLPTLLRVAERRLKCGECRARAGRLSVLPKDALVPGRRRPL